ncbi:alpha/beta hydrolase [Roseomonas sp. F4]
MVADEGVRLPRSLARDIGAHRLLIAWPETPPPAAGHRLLLLLDGNATFATAVAALRMQSRRPEVTGVGPALIVGLGHAGEATHDPVARLRDYTPPVPDAPQGSGGVADFIALLEAELLPAVASQFPIDPANRAIFGHSFGGLCVAWTLLHRPGLFQHHIAASPSLWWGEGALLRDAAAFAAAPPPGAAALRLLLTLGELEHGDAALPAERQAHMAARRIGAHIQAFAETLRLALGTLRQIEFAGENHGSVLPAALSRALRFALDPRS